jgi:3-(3-hydroxy-phenyl)propionate hydroxylase
VLELGVTFLQGHVVQQVEQDINGVSVSGATIDSVAFSATADYLLGANGGRITVRKAVGVSFDGYNPVHKLILADVKFKPGLDLSLKFRMNPGGSGIR